MSSLLDALTRVDDMMNDSTINREGDQKETKEQTGGHLCDCSARGHKLVSACVSCGRIVCEQEGSGACFFCGQLVCTKDERQLINSGTNRGRELKRKLMSVGGRESKESPSFAAASEKLRHAVEQKDKLLGFDKDSERRTKVIDDQSNYYAAENNPFLSKEDRDKLQTRAFGKTRGSDTGKAQSHTRLHGQTSPKEETEQMSMDQDPIIQEIMERTFTNEARKSDVGDRRICEEFDQLKFDDSVALPFTLLVQQQGALSPMD